MHEHLDEMGLVHMNGRIYDPLIGRFMSADPIIQAPSMLQSHNRYAYVMNNPLNLTDPSGYSWLSRFIKKVVVRTIAAVADTFGCAGYCTLAVNSYYAYKGGGLPGLAASFIPGSDNIYADAAISAAKGCAVSSLNGGNCGRGAGSALIRDAGVGNGLISELLAGYGRAQWGRKLRLRRT
jgi:RHS repeat-associated protein